MGGPCGSILQFSRLANRQFDQHPCGGGEEREFPALGLFAEPSHDDLDVLLAPVGATEVHLAGAGIASAPTHRFDPQTAKHILKLGAGACDGSGR
jgi:hypothetical protein